MKENIIRNIGIIRIDNVNTGYNSLAASSIIPRVKDNLPNAIEGPSRAVLFVKFNNDGTIKKGYRKVVEDFKKAESIFAETMNIPKRFRFIRAAVVG